MSRLRPGVAFACWQRRCRRSSGPWCSRPVASAGWFLPDSDGSPNADGIRTLYILIALIGLVIFIGVEGLLFYSMIKFRARKGNVAAQITATRSWRSAGPSAPP